MFRGFQEIVLSVADIDRIAEPFTVLGGWRAARLPDAPLAQAAIWQVPGSSRIEQCLLTPPGEDKGLVRLVRFHGVPQRQMRPAAKTWDAGGIFDIDCYCGDARALFDGFMARGWTANGEPVDYQWGGFSVCQTLPIGPDGCAVGLLQPHNPVAGAFADWGAGWGRAFNSAQIVRDFDAGMAFYRDLLGFKVVVETEVQGVVEPGRDILGLPLPLARDTLRRVAILQPDGQNDGSIELIAFPEIDGKDFSSRCHAPNLGWLCLRLPVADADAEAARLQARGADLATPPTRFALDPYGSVTLFAIHSPDGARLEFFSR